MMVYHKYYRANSQRKKNGLNSILNDSDSDHSDQGENEKNTESEENEKKSRDLT